MGGGPEIPIREGGQDGDVLLAVLPWPEQACEKIISEIKEEFPKLEIQYIQETYTDKKDRGKTEVPEGN